MFVDKIDATLIDAETLPWMPMSPSSHNVFVKVIKVDPRRREWITLLKVAADAELPRHRHAGSVHVYTISGEWKYKEHDWIAKPGSFVFETAGSEHTPIGVGKDDVITLNIVQGDWSIIDESGQVLVVENEDTVMRRYKNYCARVTNFHPFAASIKVDGRGSC